MGGDSVLLGVIPMGEMGLVILPSERKRSINPDSPQIADLITKRLINLKMCLFVKIQGDELN